MEKLRSALGRLGHWTLSTVERAANSEGSQVPPRHGVVERTLARLNRNRYLAKDLKKSIASVEYWINIASVKRLSRRIARG